jgi:hypothetical protein
MRRKDGTLARLVGDEIIVLHVDSGRYFELNNVAAFVWELLETEIEVDDIVAQVEQTFDIDTQTAVRDVHAFLDELRARDLVD